MSTRYWSYAGPHGQAGPVSTEELALLLRERMIGGDTVVSPIEGVSWAPLAHWLPELVPFATWSSTPLPAPQRPPSAPPPALPAPAPWDPPVQSAPRPFIEAAPPFALPHAPLPLATKGAWTDRTPHPWRRYWARMLDLAVMGSVMGLMLGVVGAVVAPEETNRFSAFLTSGPVGKVADLMLTLLLVIPGNALLLGLTGGTPGKWLFGIKIVRPDGRPIGVMAALWREIRVWFQGLAMGIPLVTLFTLFAGFSWLNDDGHAPWDKPRRRVALHRPTGAWQILLMLIGLVVLITLRVWLAMPSKPGA
jgi:uncharacterized RDD family membrane protein YckC